MKTLYLVRHAKSSWKESSLSDFERPLNKRGKRDAPFMAKMLHQQSVKPDLLIASPANRALTTAKIFCENLEYPFEDLLAEPRLYMASRKDILQVLKDINDTYETIILVGHNPGLTDFSNFISDKETENIPTCGIVKLQLADNSWSELDAGRCRLLSFDYPKKYISE